MEMNFHCPVNTEAFTRVSLENMLKNLSKHEENSIISLYDSFHVDEFFSTNYSNPNKLYTNAEDTTLDY